MTTGHFFSILSSLSMDFVSGAVLDNMPRGTSECVTRTVSHDSCHRRSDPTQPDLLGRRLGGEGMTGHRPLNAVAL